jgi:hypothetical protein
VESQRELRHILRILPVKYQTALSNIGNSDVAANTSIPVNQDIVDISTVSIFLRLCQRPH